MEKINLGVVDVDATTASANNLGLPKSSYPVRISVQGERYYITLSPEGEAVIYPSGTSVIKEGMPTPEYIKIFEENCRKEGKDPKVVLRGLAMYGTALHILFAQVLKGEVVSAETIEDILRREMDGKEFNLAISILESRLDDLLSHLGNLYQWVLDYNVKVLGIELMLTSHELKFCTAVDLICHLDEEVIIKVPKPKLDKMGDQVIVDGEPVFLKTPETIRSTRTITAIVDLKSGAINTGGSHQLQLYMNKVLVEENYDLKIDKVFNLSPKTRKRTVPYEFVDQTVIDGVEQTKAKERLKKVMEAALLIGGVYYENKIKKLSKKYVVGDIRDNNTVEYDYIALLGLKLQGMSPYTAGDTVYEDLYNYTVGYLKERNTPKD